jgi:hypothetical protein
MLDLFCSPAVHGCDTIGPGLVKDAPKSRLTCKAETFRNRPRSVQRGKKEIRDVITPSDTFEGTFHMGDFDLQFWNLFMESFRNRYDLYERILVIPKVHRKIKIYLTCKRSKDLIALDMEHSTKEQTQQQYPQHYAESGKESIDVFLSRDLNRPSIEELMSLLRDDHDENLIYWETRVGLSFQCPASSLSLMSSDESCRASPTADVDLANSTCQLRLSKPELSEYFTMQCSTTQPGSLVTTDESGAQRNLEHPDSDTDDCVFPPNQQEFVHHKTAPSSPISSNLLPVPLTALQNTSIPEAASNISDGIDHQPMETQKHSSQGPASPKAIPPRATKTFRRGRMSTEEHKLRRRMQNREAQRRFRQRIAAARAGDPGDDKAPSSPAETRPQQRRTHLPAAMERALAAATGPRRRAGLSCRRAGRSRVWP